MTVHSRRLLLILGMILLFGFSALAQYQTAPLVPDFTLQIRDGSQVSLSDFNGQVVVLNFWASWCAPCRAEMGDMQKLHQYFTELGKAVLLLLNQVDGVRETRGKANQYLDDNGFEMLNLYDEGMVGYPVFGITGVPVTVVIDQYGRLASYVLGPTDFDTVLTMVEALD